MLDLLRSSTIYVAPYINTEVDDYGREKDVYGKPFTIKNVVLNTLSGMRDVQMYGDRVTRMCRTFLEYDMYSKIKEKDKVYLYGAKPNDEKVNGANANYIVQSVLPQNIKCQVTFEMLPR